MAHMLAITPGQGYPPEPQPQPAPVSAHGHKRTKLLLIVDDEPFRRQVDGLADELDLDTRSETAAVDAILTYRSTWVPDAIVLDQLMPRGEYYATARALRSAFGVPVLAISSDPHVRDLIPEPGVLLLSRSAALSEVRRLARYVENGAACLTIGPLHLDLTGGMVTLHGVSLRFNPDELTTLSLLMRHEGSVVHRRTLAAAIGGIHRDLDPRIVDVHVVRLMVQLGGERTVSIERSPDQEGYTLRRLDTIGRIADPDG